MYIYLPDVSLVLQRPNVVMTVIVVLRLVTRRL